MINIRKLLIIIFLVPRKSLMNKMADLSTIIFCVYLNTFDSPIKECGNAMDVNGIWVVLAVKKACFVLSQK